ncbi:MAG TPA: ATP-binding protein [Burkholderiaceae bacterium]|nr:ATP-binding protein [Burkholderiaceae bacterium]
MATDPPTTLEQALSALNRERLRAEHYRSQSHALRDELTALRDAASDASTSRLLAEEELDDTRDRLSLALDAAGMGLWEWSVGTGDVYLSARWSELIGDVPMESHCQVADLLQRIHPDDLAALNTVLTDTVSGKRQRYDAQFRIRTYDNQWIWMESHGLGTDRDASGRAGRVVGISSDATERKRLLDATEQARQDAEKANRSKTEFLASVSHEVRTPLNGVMGLIRLLTDSPLTDEQRQWLTLMDESAQTLLHLLNDILDLSKIEAGRMELDSAPFNLMDEVGQACGPLVAQAAVKELAILVDIDPSLPESVQGDATKLRQVLLNLLSNAVKFTPRGGRVSVNVRPGPNGGVHFEVSDTGIGIAAEQQTRIFEAFTQADASTTRKYGGTGLGLAISSRLVQLMGGHIRLVSAPGQGSSFSFTLPLQSAGDHNKSSGPMSAPMELEHLSTRAQTFSGLRVLVAEDHPVNELLMRELLKKLGCSTVVARNGLEAVAAWKRGNIDLIMMDVQMPELNGLDATLEIRALEGSGFRPPGSPLPHTPIVAVTANAMSGDREKCIAAGMDAYTAKPVSPQALTQAMAEAQDVSAKWQPAPPPPMLRAIDPHTNALPTQPQAGTSLGKGLPPPIQIDKLRHRLDGDQAALSRLASATRRQLAQHITALSQALGQQDQVLATTSAHALKTALATITAERASALSNGLEKAARKGEWPLFGRALPVLKTEVARLDQALAALEED